MGKASPGTIIAVIALFIVIGGTATAASGLISGKKIKPGTVTAKQIKNKTITRAKLAPSTVKSLKGTPGKAGERGATGAIGATGPAGATGATGADGVVDPHAAEVQNFNLPYDEFKIPLSLELPAGKYLLTAKTNAVNQYVSGDNTVECTIWTDETDGVDRASSDIPFNRIFNLGMMAVAEVDGLVELRCIAWNGPAQLSDTKLIATPVQG